jgi:glycerol-3-phosphate O-acyltransferase
MLTNKLKTRHHQRIAMLGVDLPTRRTLIAETLRHESVQRAMANAAQKRGLSVTKTQRIAHSYAREIAANFSCLFARLLRPALRGLWGRVYDSVTLHHGDDLEQVIAGHTPIYLPCHRSHLDYLLLPYLLHTRNLPVPQVAAGNNLNIPVIGSMLRWGGAFYIRRSFRGNRLYGAVFQSYTATLLQHGAALEYFIEGVRSRTGLILKPRLGLLDMTLRAGLAYPQRPMVLIPIHIAYESVLESQGYLAQLAGQSKQRESLRSVWRGLVDLRKPRGEVHVNIGEPLYVHSLFDQYQPDWRTLPVKSPLTTRPDWLQACTRQLARQVVTGINHAAVVTSIGLLACAVLDAEPQPAPINPVMARFTALQQLLHTWRYSSRCVVAQCSPQDSIAQACRLELIHRPTAEQIATSETQRGLLDYHRNTVRHVLALPSAIAACLSDQARCSSEALLARITERYTDLAATLFLPWEIDALAEPLHSLLRALADLGWLHTDETGWQATSAHQPDWQLLARLA